MAIPLLPMLATDHGVDVPNQSGEWHPVGPDILGSLSKGLHVAVASYQINSIPSVWARMLLFEMALFDENHSLHEIVVGEWRGMLALLGLGDLLGLRSVSTNRVMLPTEETASVWQKSLSKLLPNAAVFENTPWTDLFVFSTNGHPFGITSPTTLVATSTEYSSVTFPSSNVRWFGSRFLDPVSPESELLSKSQRSHLVSWLVKLRNDVQQHPEDSSPGALAKKDALIQQLNDYVDSLLTEPATFAEAPWNYGILGASVFKNLNTPIRFTEGGKSNVQLVPSLSKHPRQPILLVDHDISGHWGIADEGEVVIQGPLTLADVPFEGLIPGSHNQIGGNPVRDAEVWIPTELFTPQLYYVLASDAFPGSYSLADKWAQGRTPTLNKQAISIILPIVSNLLEHLDGADILRHLVLTQNGEGDITVKLGIPLSGFTAQPRLYYVQRTYKRNEMVELNQVPILEVFPNFRSSNWNSYYVAYSADNVSATFQVTPYPDAGDATNIPILRNQYGSRWISVLKDLPEAFICRFDEKGGSGGQEAPEIGVLLIPEAESETPPPSRQYVVGVDFGASGTMIYYATDLDRKPLSFANRKLAITGISDVQKAEVLKFFLPESIVEPSFLTLYQDFSNSNGEQKALLNGHIYYFAGSPDLTDTNVHSNLKWSGEKETSARVRSYLSQLCLQSVAELALLGASSIDWRFSFPTAFDESQEHNLRAIWQDIINSIQNVTSIEFKGPHSLAESVASAECFQAGGASLQGTQASTPTGAIFIDIGGSTSDISIWQQNTLRSQLSLRFAGRDIFLRYLADHVEILDLFDIDTRELRETLDNKERFWIIADSILRNRSEEIFSALPGLFAEPSLRSYQQHLTIGLSGLLYYVGLNLNQLINRNQYTSHVPHIYLGGNGSKMFRWLSNGTHFTEEHPIARLFKSVFLDAVDNSLRGEFKIRTSERPKHESAYGLVCSPQLDTDNYEVHIIAGENFVADGEPKHWSTEIDVAVERAQIQPPAVFDRLIAFINSFNGFADSSNGLITPIQFDSRVADDVYRFVHSRCSDQSDQKVIFISALRGLLDTQR